MMPNSTPLRNGLPGQHPHTEVTGGKRPAGWSCCAPLLRALIFCPSSPKSVAALPAWREGAGSLFDLALFPLAHGERGPWRLQCWRDEAYLCRALRQLLQGRAPFPISHPMCPTRLPLCLNVPLAGTHFWFLLAPWHRLIVSGPRLVSGEQRLSLPHSPLPWYPLIPAPFFKALRLTCQPRSLPQSQCGPSPLKTHPHQPSV